MTEDTLTTEEPQTKKPSIAKVMAVQLGCMILIAALAAAGIGKAQELKAEAIKENCPPQQAEQQKSLKGLFSSAQILEGIEKGYLKNTFTCQIPRGDSPSLDGLIALLSSGNQPIFTQDELVAMALVTNHREDLQKIVEAGQSGSVGDGPSSP